MRRVLFLLLLFFVRFGYSQTANWDRANSLGKGFNLSNWLEAYWQSDEDYPSDDRYSRSDLQALKLAGMTNIRLNVNFERLLDEEPPFQLDTGHVAFSWIDSVLQWAEADDYMVVMVNHHGWDELSDLTYDAIAPRVVTLWEQLAARYAYTDPDRVLFEVMNEPPILLTRGKTRQLMNESVQAIRQYAPEHTIVVSGSLGSSGQELAVTAPLADPNLIYTFHFYDPFWFTHQGASWSPVPFPIGTEFPTILNEPVAMRQVFIGIANWRTIHDVPVYLGEFGTINYADEESKCRWIEYTGSLIDEFDFPWSYWDCKYSSGSAFGFFDGNEISPYNIRQCYRQALHLYDDGAPTPVISSTLKNIGIYPNPAKQTLKLDIGSKGPLLAVIFNSSGELVHKVDLPGSPFIIGLDALDPGLYFIRLISPAGWSETGSFVKY